MMVKFALLTASVLLVRAQPEQAQKPLSDFTSGLCCATLSNGLLGDRIVYPAQTAYETRLKSYFDVKQQTITPNCIVQPRSSMEVALAVKTLVSGSNLRPCKFAIRSGGHTPFAGASNIKNGVVIDLQHLSGVEYDANNKVVNIGPGARWVDVFTTLEPLGVMITGGRSSSVGVGGITLGGGISFFSPEHGLICDNVVEFEVVLADGRTATASQTENADLFTVLKGGSNNFGIVTSFKFRSFSYEGMWGGVMSYPSSTIDAHFEALVNFAHGMDQDAKGVVIVIPGYLSSMSMDMILNSYDYAKPVQEPRVFDEFLAIQGKLSDSTRIRNMSSLAQEFDGATSHRVSFGTLTFVMDIRVLHKAHEIYNDVVLELKAKATGDWGLYTLYQPLHPVYWRQSAVRGGNVLGLERFDSQVLCLYQPYILWQGAEQDNLFQTVGTALIDRIRIYAESIGADNSYLYLDYADGLQNPLASYGPENVRKLQAAAEKYDPTGVFQNLVPGGFKISQIK
ncbi:hypothetical protein ACEQ8H_000937 [Pleosporales sp. CAS-2024a]